jgi:hypothetical protein
MKMNRPHAQQEELEQAVGQALNTLIAEQVMDTLGKPDDLLGVEVRPLWAGRYRANVFTGAHVTAARVAHSHFLAVDGNGTITAASPTITRVY